MLVTMSTIGYGDITPITEIEKLYGILISFIACGIFAYFLNLI